MEHFNAWPMPGSERMRFSGCCPRAEGMILLPRWEFPMIRLPRRMRWFTGRRVQWTSCARELLRGTERISPNWGTGGLRMAGIRPFPGRGGGLGAGRPATFHGDGGIIGAAPVEVEVVPGAIRVLAPNRSAET